MSFLQISLLLIILSGLWLVYKVEINYIKGYVDYSESKYGKHFNIMVSMLLAVLGIPLGGVLVAPDEFLHKELIFIPVFIIVIFLIVDNFNFWRNEYRNKF